MAITKRDAKANQFWEVNFFPDGTVHLYDWSLLPNPNDIHTERDGIPRWKLAYQQPDMPRVFDNIDDFMTHANVRANYVCRDSNEEPEDEGGQG